MDKLSTKIWFFAAMVLFAIICIQDISCIISFVIASENARFAGYALTVPAFCSIPLLILLIVQIIKRKTLEVDIIIHTVADMIALIIFAGVSFIWSLVFFTAGAFAEGAGALPYGMAVNVVYIIILPVIAIIAAVIFIVTCIATRKDFPRRTRR